MTDTLRLADAPAPTPEGHAQYLLPAEAYYERAWYEREQRELFGRTWNLAAYETDLPQAGDFLPVQVGLDPVLLVRGHDGQVRSFLNMCRHRGMALACAAGHASGNIRCPYHGWEYTTGGNLDRIPQRSSQFAHVDPDDWGLVPLGTGIWDGMVFVNPDDEPTPFQTWLGDYPERVGPFDHSQLVEVFRMRVPVACNWKLYIENHVDVLHLWFLHDQSLGMYDHRRFHHGKVGLHWVSQERLRPGQERMRGLPPIHHLPDSERDVLRANLIFPNIPTSTSSSEYLTYQVVPTGPETSEIDIRLRAEPGSELAAEGLAQLLRVLRDEDGFAVEQIQRVVRSRRFQVGPLARHHEAPIADFQRDVVAHLQLQ